MYDIGTIALLCTIALATASGLLAIRSLYQDYL